MKRKLLITDFKNKHFDKTGIIIGGGTSLKYLINENYPFKKLLYNNVIIGTNLSFKIIEPNYLIFNDKYIWETFHNQINDLKNTYVVSSIGREFNDLKIPVSFNIVDIPTIGVFFPMLKGETKCNNTGSSALALCEYLGLNKIYLFGMDMCLNPSDLNDKNFHNEYINKPKKSIKIVTNTMNRHLNNIRTIIDVLKNKFNMKIISCSNFSKLNEFIEYENPWNLIN